jgi:hypothetical protein
VLRKPVYALILAIGVSLFPGAAAKADTVSDEAAFVAKINSLRAGQGLPALQVNSNLVAKARAWSAEMAAAGRIWHSTLSDGVTEDWNKLGENVGMGGSVDGLHTAFVDSPGHYKNLVDPAFGHVGIGIVMSGKTIFVTQVFMQLRPAAPVATTTTAARVTTTTRPPAPKPAPRPTVAALRPPAPTTTTTTAPAPEPPPAAPVAEAAPAPADPPRTPSALLVSVLERLRTFDS